MFLKPVELSARWGIAESTLAHWRSDGTGPTYIKFGGHRAAPVRYSLEVIKRYEEKHNIPIKDGVLETPDEEETHKEGL